MFAEKMQIQNLPRFFQAIDNIFSLWYSFLIPNKELIIMFSSFPNPIGEETFPAAWTWANRKLRRSRKARLISRVTLPAAQPFFFAAMMVFLYSLLYDCGGDLVMAYLKKVPRILEYWQTLRMHLFPDGETGWAQAKVWAVLLWGIPFCVSLAAALPAALLYYPRKRPLDPQDSPEEQARQLCLLLREAKANTAPRSSDLVGFCFLFFAIVWAALLFGFLFFCWENPATRAAVDSMAHTANLLLFAAFVAMVLGYRLIYLPLGVLLRLLSFCHVPKSVLAESERWFAQCADQAEETSVTEGET